MARQSPLRTLTMAQLQDVLDDHPELEVFLMNLYHTGLMDGRHDQATGEKTPVPFDELLF